MGFVITPDEKVRCMYCGKAPAKPTRFWGPYDDSYQNHERWHCHNFTCRHGHEEGSHEFFSCLACFLNKDRKYGCPTCGCEGEYT